MENNEGLIIMLIFLGLTVLFCVILPAMGVIDGQLASEIIKSMMDSF